MKSQLTKLYISLVIISLGTAILLSAAKRQDYSDLKNGDIIFQSEHSGQSEAIKQATHSEYSHVGILFKEKNNWMVYEAVQPVRKMELAKWIKKGQESKYEIRRMIGQNAINDETLKRMKSVAIKHLSKDYDALFGWSDDKIYCSEYVWKIYKEGMGVELYKLKSLKEYDLTSPLVQLIMQQRYGTDVPFDEKMVAPGDIYNSQLLATIAQIQ